jgi:hypothetical protein
LVDNRDGSVQAINTGMTPVQKLPDSAVQDFYDRDKTIQNEMMRYNQFEDVRQKIMNNQVDFSLNKAIAGNIENLTGSAKENALIIGQYNHLLEQARQDVIHAQNGPSSDQRAAAAIDAIIPRGGEHDNGQVLQAIKNLQAQRANTINSLIRQQNADMSRVGSQYTLPRGEWNDPSYYGNITKNVNDSEAARGENSDAYKNWFKAREASMSSPAAATGGANAPPGYHPALNGGTTGNSGGSLIKTFDKLGLKRNQ